MQSILSLTARFRRKRQVRRAWERALSGHGGPQTRFATSGLRIRRERDSWVGTEIPVGADDTLWEECDAVPQRWPDGRYVANVVDGKVTLFGRQRGDGSKPTPSSNQSLK